jgi:hypothetical protein
MGEALISSGTNKNPMLGKQHLQRLLNKSFGTADILKHGCTVAPGGHHTLVESLSATRGSLLIL